jgi:hypothetical protein
MKVKIAGNGIQLIAEDKTDQIRLTNVAIDSLPLNWDISLIQSSESAKENLYNEICFTVKQTN